MKIWEKELPKDTWDHEWIISRQDILGMMEWHGVDMEEPTASNLRGVTRSIKISGSLYNPTTTPVGIPVVLQNLEVDIMLSENVQ